MQKIILFPILLILSCSIFSQEKSLEKLLSYPEMEHASLSMSIIDSRDGRTIIEYAPDKSLIPASTLKTVTTAAALELLGPDYRFKTNIYYTGTLNKQTGILSGDIIIKGHGDPCLGSDNFPEYYEDFMGKWAEDIKTAGIKRIKGRVITDDSWYDFLPVPAKWLWEDAGNYYGAGVYGLSVFDNTYEIHFSSGPDSSKPVITGIAPEECRPVLTNRLLALGTTDEGYVFAVPYSNTGWIAGTIPSNQKDFTLKASVTDPPLLIAVMLDRKLKNASIIAEGSPSTVRILKKVIPRSAGTITEIYSPLLKDIIYTLNHQSINLYAEHLTKELGKIKKGSGSTASGIEVIGEFLSSTGADMNAVVIEDGSGLSPLDAVSSKAITDLLYFMKKRSLNFTEYSRSFPEAGKEGTMRYYFQDKVFDSKMRVKSGSMKGVRSFAGYMKTNSGNELIFCIIVNHFSGPSTRVISGIEDILKEVILNK